MEQIGYFNKEAEIRDSLIYSYFEKECIDKMVDEIVNEIIGLRKNRITLLDVAAGTGFFLKLVDEELHKHGIEARLYGLDITPRMLEALRNKGITPVWGVSNRISESIVINRTFGREEIPLEFDAIMSTLSLHHFIDPVKVVKSMRCILKEDGVAVIIDILKYHNKELQEAMKDVHPGFSIDEIRYMCQRYFKNVGVNILEDICCNVNNILCIGLFKAVLKKG